MRLIVIHGENSYLRNKNEETYRKQYRDIVYLDSSKHVKPKDSVRYSQRSLLSTITLYIIRSSDEHLPLWRSLAKIGSSNAFLHNCRRRSLTAGFKKLLIEMKAETIDCPDPRPYAFLGMIGKIAQEHELDIETNGRQALLDACGYDLNNIVNEIRKLRWIFGRRILSREDIAPYLGLLREEQRFSIVDLLLSEQYSKAQLLVENLTRQGENPLAILGMIAYFLRNVIAVNEGQPLPKLPPHIVERYLNYRQGERAKEMLALCQRADMELKTSKIGGNLALYDVVDMLRSK